MRRFHTRPAVLAACVLGTVSASSWAAEGFKVRYPLSGTLGGEIVAPIDNPGFFGSLVLTQIEVDKVTDDTGHARQQAASGRFATPAPIAGAVRTATYAGTVKFDLKQSQTNVNLILGYLSEGLYGGGRISVVFNLPFTTRLDRELTLSGQTPTLSALSPALSPPLNAQQAAAAQAGAQAGFNTAYQAQLATQSAASTGVVDGLGDAEITAAWVHRQDNLKWITGLTLAMPTGRYDAANGALNVGFGNFYTLRPGAALAYNPSKDWTLAARGSLAFNTRNKDNQLKSGDFAALDLAAAYRSPIGVIGPHVVMVKQFTDDDGGTLGANRFSATGVGLFFTTLIPGLEAAVNLSYMNMVSAKNSLSGSFFQIRASKAF